MNVQSLDQTFRITCFAKIEKTSFRRISSFTNNIAYCNKAALLLQEKELLEKQMSMGIRDGVRKQLTLSVDGLEFEPHHANKILEIENC